MTDQSKQTDISAYINTDATTAWTTEGPVEPDIEGLLGGIADFSVVAKEIVEIAEKATDPVGVLIVDDELEAVEEMTELLSTMGLRCFGATSGPDALDLVDREPAINIAVIDLKMPGMDGLELVHRLHQNPARDIECIMVSGHGSMDVVQEAMHEHVREFLVKPIDSDALIDGVTRLGEEIARRHAAAVGEAA